MADLTPLKIGKATLANTYLAIWMAEAAGFYADQGLQLETVEMVGGRCAGPAFAEGRIQVMHIGMSSVVRANAAGADLVTVGSLSNVIRGTLFAAPDIRTAADLKGGVIGISSTGSETDATATLALHRLGLTRADVTVKEIGAVSLAAILDGTVTAGMLSEPDRSEAFAAGLNPLADLLAERVPWLFSGLVVRRDFLRDRRDTVARFLKATIEGNYLALGDEARAREILVSKMGLADPKYIDIAYENFRSLTPANAEVTREGAQNIIDIVAGPDAARAVDEYLDASVHDDLRAEGFLDAMRAKYG